jgi:hypothetical protein
MISIYYSRAEVKMKKAILCLTLFLLSQFFPPKINGSADCLIQVFKGNGSIYDIKTGGRISLKDNQLLNILIIAEGYTQTAAICGCMTGCVIGAGKLPSSVSTNAFISLLIRR